MSEDKLLAGECRLTRTDGKFVRAHIIPAALTPLPKGRPLAQAGPGYRPRRRWQSWYDMRLVTRPGEDILSAYDDWGIRELRRHRLIWRSWGQSRELDCDEFRPLGNVHGVREITSDPERLRLFFVSLLWRAAETSLQEFDEIELPEADRELLRLSLIGAIPPAPDFYPIMLTQLSTRGPPHNMTALAQEKPVPDPVSGEAFVVPIFRFYFDGLIVHFHRPPLRDPAAALGPMVVGNEPRLVIPTVKFEGSWQFQNLVRVQAESERDFPGELDRALGSDQ